MAKNIDWAYYAGKRFSDEGKSFFCFIMPQGKELWFSKVRRVYIGYAYILESPSQIKTTPKDYLDAPEVAPELIAEWECADSIARQKERTEKASKKALKLEHGLVSELAPIKKRFERCRSFEDRIAFEKLVLRILNS